MKDLDFKSIGIKIRERRRSLQITQEMIANKLDVNPSHICNIECGRANPSLTALVRIADILQCSVDCFLVDEYTYNEKTTQKTTLDDTLMKKLKFCTEEKKEKLLKIIDIL